MSFTHQIASAPRAPRVRCSTPADLEQLEQALHDLLSDGREKPPPILLDLVRFDDFRVAAAGLAAERLGAVPTRSRAWMAVLADGLGGQIVARILAMYLTHAGFIIEVFTDQSSAVAWLMRHCSSGGEHRPTYGIRGDWV
jgi:hypothetical protein